ncbi:MAG: polyprenyl synthetase family protein [Bacteroidales bacterium]|nr:polyprenyl synthetase family protein [Bacteroidales bacterium]
MFLDNRDSIHALMVSVTESIKYELNIVVNSIANNNNFSDDYFTIIKNRNGNKNWLRPFLTAFFMSGENKDLSDMKNLLTAVELFNVSTYHSNLCFDNKIEDHLKINHYIYSMLMYDVVYQLVYQIDNKCIEPEKKDKIIHEFQKCNTLTYAGQYKDLNELNIKNLEIFSNNKDFINAYRKRCLLISSSLPLCAKIGLITSNEQLNKVDSIVDAISSFGILLQIVNDISDCSKMHRKKENLKRYSDFYNGKMTLPLYMFYKQHNIHSQEQINHISKEELDILFFHFFEDDMNTDYISEIMITLWKECISRMHYSCYNLKEFFAYLYPFVFSSNLIPHKIKFYCK